MALSTITNDLPFIYLTEDNIKDDFKCQYICTMPLQQPVQHSCGQMFCKICIEKNHNKCPQCNTTDNFSSVILKIITNYLDDLQVKCKFCDFVTKRCIFNNHSTDCVYLLKIKIKQLNEKLEEKHIVYDSKLSNLQNQINLLKEDNVKLKVELYEIDIHIKNFTINNNSNLSLTSQINTLKLDNKLLKKVNENLKNDNNKYIDLAQEYLSQCDDFEKTISNLQKENKELLEKFRLNSNNMVNSIASNSDNHQDKLDACTVESNLSNLHKKVTIKKTLSKLTKSDTLSEKNKAFTKNSTLNTSDTLSNSSQCIHITTKGSRCTKKTKNINQLCYLHI